MSYTVGLDFGTHQTKVCVEDASNPAQKIYEFFEFDDPVGSKSVLLPSIVQINQDDTLSYGFVDENNCKVMSQVDVPKPILELPQEPKLELPIQPPKRPMPSKPKKPDLKGLSLNDQLTYQQNFKKELLSWENENKQIDEENKRRTEEWELECHAIRIDYEYDLEEYESEKVRNQEVFEKALTDWENACSPKNKFSGTSNWLHFPTSLGHIVLSLKLFQFGT